MTLSLSSLFTSVAVKTLALVDLPNLGSHQHELNGSSRLRDFFGHEKVTGGLHWHYFAEDDEPVHEVGTFTFYDSRAKSASRTGRTEWRMYYTGEFLQRASPGDLLILARSTAGDLHALVLEADSSWMRSATVLFDVEVNEPKFLVADSGTLDRRKIEFVSQRIIEELQLDLALPADRDFRTIARRELKLAREHGLKFPSTARMAELARLAVTSEPDEADATILKWLDAEERIFRAVEQLVVDVKLRAGFDSVDDFVAYSLSVQNRRKSRMGLALQNHLGELFRLNNIRFEAQAFTENRKRPDFLFPGSREYHDLEFNASRLSMLAAKSSCKERWPQILTEADRIEVKHLCTLEAAISEAQTQEMQRKGVVLVLPSALHATYTASQRRNLMTLRGFIEQVRAEQSGRHAR